MKIDRWWSRSRITWMTSRGISLLIFLSGLTSPRWGGAWSKKVVGTVAAGVGKVLRIQNKTLDPVAYREARVLVSLSVEEAPPKEI